ncbi:hypothetical protein HDU98_000320, partial [Podochytrium sp. JEL0797]
MSPHPLSTPEAHTTTTTPFLVTLTNQPDQSTSKKMQAETDSNDTLDLAATVSPTSPAADDADDSADQAPRREWRKLVWAFIVKNWFLE